MNADTSLNIVFVIPSLWGGGAERVVLNLCSGLERFEKAKCHIVCFSARKDFIIPRGVDVRICPLPPRTFFGYRKRCAQVLDKFILENFGRPDMVFANITLAIKCLRHSRLPVVNVIHCAPSMECLAEHKGVKRWLRKKRVEADYAAHPATCVSQGCREDFMRNFSVSQPVYTVLNPIEPQEINRQAADSAALPEIEKLGEYIIHVGAFKYAKDHATLLRAYAQSGIKEKLVLLGQPSGKPICWEAAHKLVRALGLQDKVLFLGFKTNPFPFIKRAKLFVLSSVYEGFAMVLAEAVALGTPVVSTDCPYGPREIVGPDYAHTLSPVKDARALARNIRAAIANPKKYTVELNPNVQIEEVCRQYVALIKKTAPL